MPENEVIERARRDETEGKSPSTQAGEFVREEMHHIREGKHGASSTKQAIAVGLSKARRAGVKLSQPSERNTSTRARKRHGNRSRPAKTRSRAASSALKREGRSAASHASLSRQAKRAARTRSSSASRRAGRKAGVGRKPSRGNA
jgi:hypothetical protein